MKKSKYLKISLKDVSKGFIMTVGTTIAGLCSESLVSGAFPVVTDFINMGKVGLLSGVVYILKNLFTNSQDEFLKKEKTDLETNQKTE